ncbi:MULTISPECIES: TRAP transporter small permease [Hydrogenophaga]|uniref:TRAP transporter small permease protein n=2 Tax=Hydrogenophaga TaxID=47420 RepID=A0ABW2QN18_9BURK
MLNTLRTGVDRLLQAALVLCFAVLSFCVLWQVFTRYVLNDPSTFTEEVSRFAVIWLSLLGTAYACGKLEHMAYDMWAAKLSGPALLRHMQMVALIVLLFVVAVFVYGGGKLVLRAHEVEQLSATLEVPMSWVYACIPLSGLCMTFYQLAILIAPERFKAPDEVKDALDHAEKEIAA